IDKHLFDVDALHWQKSATLKGSETPLVFELRKRDLPEPVPAEWQLDDIDGDRVRVSTTASLEVKLDSYRDIPVKSACQLPLGFDPGALYNSHYHPRALQLAVIGASDAIQSTGLAWSSIVGAVRPDEVG